MSKPSQPNDKNPWNLPNTKVVPQKATKKPNKNSDPKSNGQTTNVSSKFTQQQPAKLKALQLSKGYESSSDEEIESQTIGTRQ